MNTHISALWAFEARAERKAYATEYIELAGDLVTGILLNQIICDSMSERIGETNVFRHGKRWMAKSKAEWIDEIGITAKQYDTSIRKLVAKGLVEHAVMRFDGAPTCHIWLNEQAVCDGLFRMLSVGPTQPATTVALQ